MSETKLTRLNKVLREFNISLDRAVEFLASNGHDIDARPTTKISADQYNLFLNEFSAFMLTKTSTGRSETAATEAAIAAIWIFSCSPEQSNIKSGSVSILYPIVLGKESHLLGEPKESCDLSKFVEV